MFEKNTKQVNQMIANMFAASSIVILILVLCSATGVFEFGRAYTKLIFVVGLIIAITPKILIRFLPDTFLKYYMLIFASIFIGVLGVNAHVGIYITYALVPIVSCLYFDPKLVIKTSVFSYLVMIASIFVGSKTMLEVVYLGRSRAYIFSAYSMGFTIEFFVVSAILYALVNRAKKMMEERYSAEEQNRMKSKFLSNMSHEIRTPMNAIIGMSDVALQMEMSDDLRKYLEIINSSSVGLLEIINDILDISKVEAGKLTIISDSYSTKSLIGDMTAMIDARNDGKLPIYYHIADDLPKTLEGDMVRIKQVMLNYASNAIKYTDSGRIDITVTCEMRNDSSINLIYSVKDTGQGIKEEDIDTLFTMYGQLNEKLNHGKEGTGIGLALSKSFIEHMGGTVDVESQYGVGSIFSFSVPQKIASDSEEIASTENDPDSYLFTTKNTHILLVDDNEINREVVKAMLEPLQLSIDEATNGQEAIDMCGLRIYDLILMDSHMPIMRGEEASKIIRSTETNLNQHSPIIALTADAIAGVKEKLISCGMNDYVEKPIHLPTLCKVLRNYLPEDKIITNETKVPLD